MEPSRGKAICLPCDDEAFYKTIVDDPLEFRRWLCQAFRRHPELFPTGFEQGFTLHDRPFSKKRSLQLRRIKIAATGRSFLVRPSFVLPYMGALTHEVEKALFLRQWGEELESLCGILDSLADTFWIPNDSDGDVGDKDTLLGVATLTAFCR